MNLFNFISHSFLKNKLINKWKKEPKAHLTIVLRNNYTLFRKSTLLNMKRVVRSAGEYIFDRDGVTGSNPVRLIPLPNHTKRRLGLNPSLLLVWFSIVFLLDTLGIIIYIKYYLLCYLQTF